MILVAYVKQYFLDFVAKNLGRKLTNDEIRQREAVMQVASRSGADRVVKMLRDSGHRAYWYETPE